MSHDLASWLPRQRWYGDKGREIAGFRTVEETPFPLVELRFTEGAPSLYNAAEDESWLEPLRSQARIRGRSGCFEFETWNGFDALGEARPLGVEQSNTSLVCCDAAGLARAILKLFRRLRAGENPEIEIPRALARRGAFDHVPRPLGQARYLAADGTSYALVSLQAYVPNRGDGWTYLLRQLTTHAATGAELRLLGRRTAELHRALAAITDAAFAPEPITAGDWEHWRRRALAAAGAPVLEPYRDLLAPWRARLLADGIAIQGFKHRIHGDYHLGQVLRTPDEDWVILDFEGEPARPMSERRRKGSPLQDVAGMLRSFSYAAHASGQRDWEAEARAGFLEGYAEVAEGLDESGLRFFEMEKAVYELAYELAHRPDWVAIPLAGIRALVARC